MVSAESTRQAIRRQMAVAERFAYFDHAAVAPIPLSSRQAIVDYAETCSQCGDVKWLDWSKRISSLRGSCARLIHARTADEIALVSNTTHGINIIAEALPWQPGDNVVIPDNEFPSNFLPWRGLQWQGVEVRQVPIEPCGTITAESIFRHVDSRTRLISLSWVGFASGYRTDPAPLVELAHRRGCLVMLDAIQGLGAFPLNVQECGVDFVCADGHKWLLGPEGAGFLYIKSQHLDMLRPVGMGWASLADGSFEPGATRLKTSAARYEGGTSNMPGLLGLSASIAMLESSGAALPNSPVAEAIRENVNALAERLTQAGFVARMPHHPENRSGIVGIEFADPTHNQPSELLAARQYLLQEDIVLSVRAGRLRASTHAYNNGEDIERLVDALIAFRRVH
ncbi:MAG: aminotransferase class V-fold PLP-dependent enzyme [Planctomycetales bacterium]|nr:aminotransferase class V-fold PLP-dependent enzyme [Planctomycetales bacterium]